MNKIEDQKQTAFVSGFTIGGQSISPVRERKVKQADFNLVGTTLYWDVDEDFILDNIYLQYGFLNNTSTDATIEIGINGSSLVKAIFYLRTGTPVISSVSIPFPSVRIKKGEKIGYYCAPTAGTLLGGATFSLIGHSL